MANELKTCSYTTGTLVTDTQIHRYKNLCKDSFVLAHDGRKVEIMV